MNNLITCHAITRDIRIHISLVFSLTSYLKLSKHNSSSNTIPEQEIEENTRSTQIPQAVEATTTEEATEAITEKTKEQIETLICFGIAATTAAAVATTAILYIFI